MLESLFAYLEAHDWARWAFVAVLFAPPLLASLSPRVGFVGSLGNIAGWWALLIIVALLLL